MAAILALHADTVRSLLHEPRFVDDADGSDRPHARRGHQLFGEHGLDLAFDALRAPGRIGEETLQRQNLVLADGIVFGLSEHQSHGFGAFAACGEQQAVEINERLRPSFGASKERGKAIVEMNQFIRRGAYFIYGHGGVLLIKKPPDWPARVFPDPCFHCS